MKQKEIERCLRDPFFIECLMKTAANKRVVKEFDRFTGFNLSLKAQQLLKIVETSLHFHYKKD